MNLFTKKERDSQTQKTNMVADWQGQLVSLGRSCTPCYIQKHNQQGTIVQHRTLLNVMCQPGWEGVLGELDTYMCLAESLHCSPEITTWLIGYTSTQNKNLKV